MVRGRALGRGKALVRHVLLVSEDGDVPFSIDGNGTHRFWLERCALVRDGKCPK